MASAPSKISSSPSLYAYQSNIETKRPFSLTQKCSEAMNSVREGLFKAINFVAPRNPLTHQRQFFVLPIGLEFALGQFAEMSETHIRLHPSEYKGSVATTQKVYDALINILPGYKEYPWPTSLRICQKSTLNAYCAPGCRVTVYTGLIEKVKSHLATMKSIEFKDKSGQKIVMDVSDVEFDDVMAALLGHELTHGAARHSGARIAFGLILDTIISISSSVLKEIANSFFKEQKRETNHHNTNRADTKDKYAVKTTFTPIGTMLNLAADIVANEAIQSFIRFSVKHSYSRSNEYQADEYGMRLAQKAGFNPKGGIVLAEILRRESYEPENRIFRSMLSFVSTHPLSTDRLRANYETLKELEKSSSKSAAPTV